MDAAGAETPIPSLAALQDTGVVDVGSFEVGLDRIEISPPAPAPVAAPPVSPVMPQARPATSPPPSAPAASPLGGGLESRERDFFGFETELAEVVGGPREADTPMEVSFDIEEPAPSASGPQASFIVPEPALVRYRSPEPPPPIEEGPSAFAEAPVGLLDLPGVEEMSVEAADLPPLVQQPAFDEGQFMPDTTLETPEPRPAPAPPPPPAAPIRVPVAPAPSAMPPAPKAAPIHVPPPPAAKPVAVAPAFGTAGDLDPAVRKIIEEKVEKIVWEVVPEMAEVLIKEAIEKIRSGG